MAKNDGDGTTVADLIGRHLVRTGLTDSEFADLVGVHQTQISRWRRGVGVPRSSQISELAEALDLEEKTVEAARVRGDALRLRLADESPRSADPREELRRVRSELKKSKARIARLEAKLRER